MTSPFSRTLRSLKAERPLAPLVIVCAGTCLMLAWIAWASSATICVLALSSRARLEVARAVHPIQAPFTAKVLASELRLSRAVEPGDVLLELDAEPQRLERAEAQARLEAIDPELEALRKELSAKTRVLADRRSQLPIAVDEARALRAQAESTAELALDELARIRQLHAHGAVTELELRRAEAAAHESRWGARARKLSIRGTELERQSELNELRADFHDIERDIEKLEGARLTTRANLSRIENEIERRLVRAPVRGVLAEVASLTTGSMVSEGQRVAAIVPEGALQVVAEFPPAAVLGRASQGQLARLRLDGFPWTEFGTVPARVVNVGQEIRDGSVQVELALTGNFNRRIPLGHGLTGSLEIELEHATPAALLLRGVGKWLNPTAKTRE